MGGANSTVEETPANPLVVITDAPLPLEEAPANPSVVVTGAPLPMDPAYKAAQERAKWFRDITTGNISPEKLAILSPEERAVYDRGVADRTINITNGPLGSGTSNNTILVAAAVGVVALFLLTR